MTLTGKEGGAGGGVGTARAKTGWRGSESCLGVCRWEAGRRPTSLERQVFVRS